MCGMMISSMTIDSVHTTPEKSDITGFTLKNRSNVFRPHFAREI